MTTLVDIYEAAGHQANEDRTQVDVSDPSVMRPFEIVLKVVPMALAFTYDRKETVTFAVLLDDEYVVSPDGRMKFISHETEIEIPVDQVKILTKED